MTTACDPCTIMVKPGLVSLPGDMSIRPLLLLALLSPAACGPGGDSNLLGDVVALDDASDEVLAIIADHLERDGATIDDTKAAALVAPTADQVLPADPAATLEWTVPGSLAVRSGYRHGVETGTFVWVRVDGPNLEQPIDVVALTTTAYQVSPTRWTTMTGAGGSFTATITTAVVDRGEVVEGPYQPSDPDVSFTIGQ